MAKDIVEIFEDYATTQSFRYKYGNRNVLNLLQSNSADFPDQVHLLVESVTRQSEIGSMGLSRNAVLYSGRYILALPDDYASHVYNENETDISKSKYKIKIKPLLTNFKELESQFMACDGLDILTHENSDTINFLDANLTGLFCTFKFRVYEN
jgi:hypothetical protein